MSDQIRHVYLKAHPHRPHVPCSPSYDPQRANKEGPHNILHGPPRALTSVMMMVPAKDTSRV